MKLTSIAFGQNQSIPPKYTCDGANVNPPFRVEEVPEKAMSLALIVDDPDAPFGVWDHWIVWDISPATVEIPENTVPGIQGRNGWSRSEYGGPCPPRGAHRYFFKLYALDTELDLEAGAKKKALKNAMKGHILAEAELVGVYRRQEAVGGRG